MPRLCRPGSKQTTRTSSSQPLAHHPPCRAVAGDTIAAGVEALSDALELGAFDDKTPAALTISREYMGRMTTAERLTM